ncbi:hypothetical protein VCRLGP8_940012 [Vibrio crassostreae]|nr:hypothetical protein VCRLGP8_940012 [Vibrio crassostreae]
MIENNRTRVRGQRRFHDFTRIDRSGINGTVEHLFGAQHSMLIIEEDNPNTSDSQAAMDVWQNDFTNSGEVNGVCSEINSLDLRMLAAWSRMPFSSDVNNETFEY